jgi:hypothetical protein
MADELWTIDQVAAFLGVKPGSARGTLSRWEVRAVRREIDDRGRAHSLFDPAEVRAAQAARPGQGARSDRKAS